MFLCGNFALKALQIGEIMSNNEIMQFSFFYWKSNEKKADEKTTLFHDLRFCVILLEICIMGYYWIVVWFTVCARIWTTDDRRWTIPFLQTFLRGS